MRCLSFLFASLSSCSLFVSFVNPCLDSKPNADAICFKEGTPQQQTTVGPAVQIKAGDIDGDGLTDLVVLNDQLAQVENRSVLHVLFQNAPGLSKDPFGSFTDQPINGVGSVFTFDVADINPSDATARADIVVLSGGRLLLISRINGTFQFGDEFLVGPDIPPNMFANVTGVAFGDFNVDGIKELAVASVDPSNGNARVHNFPISGLTIGPLPSFDTSIINDDMALGPQGILLDLETQNFDPPSGDEFVAFTQIGTTLTAQLYANNGENDAAPKHTVLPFDTNITIFAFGVLDGTAVDFVIAAAPNLLNVVFTEGQSVPGNLAQPPDVTPNELPFPIQLPSDLQAVTLADVDGDTFLDIVVVIENQIEVFRNNHDKTFSDRGPLFLKPSDEARVVVEGFDINGDTVADLIAPDLTGGFQLFLSAP
jgi:hypothetical protein